MMELLDETVKPLGLVCRPMRPSDLDLVVKNEELSYPNPWSKRIFLDCLRAGYECWVLATREQVLAHGVLSFGLEESHVLTLCVHPHFRRHGLGRRMLRHLLRQAEKKGAEVCFLEVRPSNVQARNLYLSLGFVQVGERRNYYPADPGSTQREDALILSKMIRIP
ncbi:MAG: ribosomal protein S18-alanine N-acetyltransferase [Pseudomonadales bacterium]|nr:ribosomal protein S18-alanine N-acetyltransferase [Pseudomonadales bacterium]